MILSFFKAQTGTISLKLYKSLYSSIFPKICSWVNLSILLSSNITGLLAFSSTSITNLSPVPSFSLASTTYNITSVSFIVKYACLFTDTYRVIGILLNNDFKVFKVSDLLLDEAFDTISISKRCNLSNIAYNIIDNRNINYFKTRNEEKIENYLREEFKKNKLNDSLKLSYLYFEYFSKNPTNIELAYTELNNSFLDGITNKHLKLYELIKLSNKEKV